MTQAASPSLGSGPLTTLAAAVCPKAPPGAEAYAADIQGYVLWGVLSLFVVGIVTSIGAIVAGRVFAMPHASRAGVVGVAVILLAAVAYMVAPGMVSGITGTGCI